MLLNNDSPINSEWQKLLEKRDLLEQDIIDLILKKHKYDSAAWVNWQCFNLGQQDIQLDGDFSVTDLEALVALLKFPSVRTYKFGPITNDEVKQEIDEMESIKMNLEKEIGGKK